MLSKYLIPVILITLTLQAQDPLVGVASNPASPSAWDKLEESMSLQGKQLIRFKFNPPVSFWRDEKTGEQDFEMSPLVVIRDPANPESAVEGPAWLGYLQSKMPQEPKQTSDFQAEVESWRRTLAIADGRIREKKVLPKDPILVQFSVFRNNKDLEAAIFLLCFRESYRADFETWKATNPDGVHAFIERYRLRPDFVQKKAIKAPIESTISGPLQGTILRMIQEKHDETNRQCRYVKLLKAKVLAKDWSKDNQMAPITLEAWTIESRCEKQFTYMVYLMKGGGHNLFRVTNMDFSGITVTH